MPLTNWQIAESASLLPDSIRITPENLLSQCRNCFQLPSLSPKRTPSVSNVATRQIIRKEQANPQQGSKSEQQINTKPDVADVLCHIRINRQPVIKIERKNSGKLYILTLTQECGSLSFYIAIYALVFPKTPRFPSDNLWSDVQ